MNRTNHNLRSAPQCFGWPAPAEPQKVDGSARDGGSAHHVAGDTTTLAVSATSTLPRVLEEAGRAIPRRLVVAGSERVRPLAFLRGGAHRNRLAAHEVTNDKPRCERDDYTRVEWRRRIR